MFRVRASARLATPIRRSPGKGRMLASRDRLPQASPRTRNPAASTASARNAAHIGNNQKFELFIFSSLRTLFPAANPQPSPFQTLAHSFTQNRKLTQAFTITSTLFARSFAQERKSTLLFSTACALFCRNGGCAVPVIVTQSKERRQVAVARACSLTQNKAPADQIDTKTTCAVSLRER
jgi:hypothetical protein